jgi:hypothetical protein
MNIEQLSTNKLVRPSGREDLAEMIVAAGSRESAPPIEDREWPFSKAVFVALISSGYVCGMCSPSFLFHVQPNRAALGPVYIRYSGRDSR